MSSISSKPTQTQSEQDQQYHHQKKMAMRKADLKVVLLGDMDVGKTSLVLRYVERRFQETVNTIGASFLLKQWGNYNIAIWDTAGEEKYQGLNLFYCRNSSAAILMFDLTNLRTFETLRLRYLPLLDSVDSFVLKIVVGSKLDLLQTQDRQVTPEEAKEFAKSINDVYCQTNEVPYFETSSRTGYNVDNVFEIIFEHFFPSQGKKPRSASNTTLYGFQQIDRSSIVLSRSSNDTSKTETWKCCS